MDTKKTLAVTIGGLIILVVGWLLWQANSSNEPIDPSLVLSESGEWVEYEALEPTGNTIDAVYRCDEDSFSTSYDLGSNELMLILDGGTREFILPQAVSEEGAKYALRDGSVVFYEAAGTARVEIGGQPIYEDCVPEL